MLLLILLLSLISQVECGFIPKKYELSLTTLFDRNDEFNGEATIHVGVTGSVKEFDLKVSKDLNVQKVTFTQGNTVQRGRANCKFDFFYRNNCFFSAIIQPTQIKMNEKENKVHATLLSAITPESIKEEGFITVEYKGKIGKKDAKKGLYFSSNNADLETDLKNGNAIYLFPILEDVAAPLTLSVIAPYRTGVETNLKDGEHKSFAGSPSSLFSNNFNSGNEKMKISDLKLKINAPRALILQSS
uniref:Dolichyl-diphosphooligosaccharide--protein glycosyltransferase subunit 1 n=1 Tax=Caenorhabditis tropicalis TaxID=1561998 RepID=A0A1I7UVZ3_9PELO